MLIVKPYGRSIADRAAGALRRRLLLRPDDAGPRDFPPFADAHPELLIAQWISTIDGIARKPPGRKKPTREQRELRQKLGDAAWKILRDKLPPNRMAELEKRWWRKIHPYGEGVDDGVSGKEKGRWFARFASGTEAGGIGKAEASEIAGRIEEHLHETEYRIGGDRPNRRRGRIAARAESVAGNVSTPVCTLPQAEWSEGDRERYRKAGDVAQAVGRGAREREARKRRVGPAVAAKVLHAHYAKLFRDGNGEPLSIAGAKESCPGLFALHMAVREAYARILKNHGKDRPAHGEARRPVSALLPDDMDALFRLVEAVERNRDLNALLRLGKLIHYEGAASAAAGDDPAVALDRWPDGIRIDGSRYRTGDGQAEIKRNEAFVRVWRGAVTLAQRTLTDWADSEGGIDRDVLAKDSIDKACGAGFDEDAYDARLPILFGDRARLFRQAADGKEVLRLALEGWTGLRNGCFHFRGRGGFALALRRGTEGGAAPEGDGRIREVVRELLKTDMEDRRGRLIRSLRAAHVERSYGQKRIEALLRAVATGAPARQAPLPRFRRVLDRTEKAWRQGKLRLRLPAPENRRTMEANPGRLARYIVLKTLYERAFPAWLEKRDAGALNRWVDRAAARATAAARSINKDGDAVARAAGLVRLAEGEGIAGFADRLARETATEYRVQRGYASDPDAARRQAGHIENLRCDVVAQAFEAYLEEAGFGWALEDPANGPLPEEKLFDLDRVALPPGDDARATEDWLAMLYFLIHLVPVEAVAGLRHQLRKWAVLEPAPHEDTETVERILELYLDMHDAKFEGGEGVAGAEALKGLFEHEEDFRDICPESPGADTGGHIPWRGLREMMRFGAREPRLMFAFEKHPVSRADVKELRRLEAVAADGGPSPVAKA